MIIINSWPCLRIHNFQMQTTSLALIAGRNGPIRCSKQNHRFSAVIYADSLVTKNVILVSEVWYIQIKQMWFELRDEVLEGILNWHGML